MIKRIILLLVLLMIPLVQALPNLNIDPASITIQANKGVQSRFNLTLNNSGDKEIINLNFSNVPYGSFPTVSNLLPNTIMNYEFSIYPTLIYSGLYTSTITFYYYTNQSANQQVYNVIINDSGYLNHSITMKTLDTLIIHNIGLNNHTFTKTDLSIDQIINPGQSTIFQPDSTGTFIFFDRLTGSTLSVDVISPEQEVLTHSGSLDKVLTLDISVYESPTNIVVNLIKSLYIISAKDSKQLAIEIVNIGSKPAQNINFSMKWLNTTNYVPLTLNPGENKYFHFDIIPNVTKTAQTNQSYKLNITILGDNFINMSKEIQIFIPYQILDYETIGNRTFLIQKLELNINETIDYCKSEAGKEDKRCDSIKIEIEKIIYQPQQSQFPNITNDELFQIITKTSEIPNNLQNIENRIKETNSRIDENTNQIVNMDNKYTIIKDMLVSLVESIDTETFWKGFWTILWTFIIIGVTVGLTIIVIKKKYYKFKKWKKTGM